MSDYCTTACSEMHTFEDGCVLAVRYCNKCGSARPVGHHCLRETP